MLYVTHLDIAMQPGLDRTDYIQTKKRYRRTARAWFEKVPFDFEGKWGRGPFPALPQEMEEEWDRVVSPLLHECAIAGDRVYRSRLKMVTAQQDEENEAKREEWFRLVYETLRAYYGKMALPPLEVLLEAADQGSLGDLYTEILSSWREWTEETGTETATIFLFVPDFSYAHVVSPTGGIDLWEWDTEKLSLEIWFGHGRGDEEDDSALLDAVFKPLLEARASVGFVGPLTAPIEVSYVLDQRGIRTASLEDLLQEVLSSGTDRACR